MLGQVYIINLSSQMKICDVMVQKQPILKLVVDRTKAEPNTKFSWYYPVFGSVFLGNTEVNQNWT